MLDNDFQADLAAAKCKKFDELYDKAEAFRSALNGAVVTGELDEGAADTAKGHLDDMLSDLRFEMKIEEAIDDLAEWECPRHREPEVMFRYEKPGGTL